MKKFNIKPIEQSLASVDSVLDKLQIRVQEMSQETERLTDTQYNKNLGTGNKELENAKDAIQVLFS